MNKTLYIGLILIALTTMAYAIDDVYYWPAPTEQEAPQPSVEESPAPEIRVVAEQDTTVTIVVTR